MSITTNADTYPFDLDDNSLHLLQSAIKSHYDDGDLFDKKVSGEKKASSRAKREHEKDDETVKSIPKKAGRKPLPEKLQTKDPLDPKQKRKAQNRAAQRAFRDRKEKHVSELQERIAELEALNATKDESLLKENRELKEMLKKLQEENYALKGNQFTFQFPLPKEDHAASSSSGTEDGSSAEHTSPSTDASPSSLTEPVQFGLVGDSLLGQSFGNDLLIHGKDDLFSNNYQPFQDNFLFPNIDLTGLFGDDGSFGMDMAHQFGLPEVPSLLDKKRQWLEGLKKAKAEGKSLYQFQQEISREMPDFDLDSLCNDLKQKAQCSTGNYIVTDKDIDNLSNCINASSAYIF